MKNIHVISVSYTGRLLEPGSKELERMKEYAKYFGKFSMVVFTTIADNKPECIDEDGVKIFATNTRTKLGAFLKGIRLLKTLHRQETELKIIANVQDPFKLGLISFLAFPSVTPLVVQLHGDYFSPGPDQANSFWRWLGTKVLDRAYSIRVVSTRIKQSLKELGIAEKKVQVLPIHYSVDRYFSIGKDRQYVPKPNLECLFVGRLAPEKNLPLLINAIKAVNERGREVSLTIVGEGSEKKSLIELVKQLNISAKVTFCGWQEDLESYYRHADIFLLGSNHEGWGMVLVEAMASGLPIITTDVGCVGEVVTKSEAMIVPVKDQTAFSAALEDLASTPAAIQSLGQAGYTTARSTVLSSDAYTQAWVHTITSAA